MNACTAPSDARHAEQNARELQSSVLMVLRQIIELLNRMSQEQFTRSPVGAVRSGVGPHVRHCLDHFDAFLSAMVTGRLDYDHRERGTPVERVLDAALMEAHRLRTGLGALDPSTLERPLDLQAQASEDGPALPMRTSALRELHYLLSHTIHHNALLGVMARELGVPVPDRFGYAPSTLTYLNRQACAH